MKTSIHKETLLMKKSLFLALVLLLISALGLAACGGGGQTEQAAAPTSQGDAAKGKELFTTCSACHGPKGEGVSGLGKDMTQSKFIAGKTDEELVEFIKAGRPASDPLNTTGVNMPPKGSNPALSDEDLYDIVAYIRTLKK
jgi:mono/diheme cytochrome c family protein